MGFNLSAFIGGAAERGSEIIAEDREQQRNIVAGRLKKAVESKATYQKKIEAEKKAVKETYIALSRTENYNLLTEEQQVAILSSPAIATDFLARVQAGNPFNVNEVYKFKGSSAEKMSTRDYITQYGQEAPATKDMTKQMEGLRTGLFGGSMQDADEISAAYGETTVGLMSYEGREAPDRAPMAMFAEGAFAKPMTLEDRLKKAQMDLDDATTPEQRAAAEARIDAITARLNYGQNPERLTALVDQLEMQIMRETDPAKKRELEARRNDTNARIRSNSAAQAQEADVKGKNSLTYPQLRGAVDRRIEEDLIAKFGLNAIREGKIIEYITDKITGETRQVLRSPKAEMLPELQAAKRRLS